MAPDIALVLNSMGACYLRIDRSYVIREANGAALEWLGLSDRDVIGQPFSRVSPNSPMRMLRSAIEGTIFIDRELRSYRRPERLVELHVHSTEDGAIVYFRDITEQRRLENDARRAMALLQASLDAVTAQVIILDARGGVIASNRAWRQFAGEYAPAILAGAAHADRETLHSALLARHPDAQRIAATVRLVLTGRRRSARIAHAWQMDGQVRQFHLNAARFECAGEAFVVVTNEDLTAVRQAEKALDQVAGHLLAAREEERRHIAEELHDSTMQHLVAIGLNVMTLRSLPGLNVAAQPLLDEIGGSLDEASKELRSLTYLLHPPRLERDGLYQTLRAYTTGFARRTGLHTKLRATRAADDLPSSVQKAILRIVQEGLGNVHRHACATRATVDLRCLRGQLHLIIRDNGRGMHRTASAAVPGAALTYSGFGLPGIRARVEQLGGGLQILSGPGGTRLHAIMPLTAGMPAVASDPAILTLNDNYNGHVRPNGAHDIP